MELEMLPFSQWSTTCWRVESVHSSGKQVPNLKIGDVISFEKLEMPGSITIREIENGQGNNPDQSSQAWVGAVCDGDVEINPQLVEGRFPGPQRGIKFKIESDTNDQGRVFLFCNVSHEVGGGGASWTAVDGRDEADRRPQ